MRRPSFKRWIRSEVLRIAGERRFNMRILAARAQKPDGRELAEALLLDAHEHNQVKRLLTFFYNEELRDELESLDRRIGERSLERLALRGTPMLVFPVNVREILERFEQAYHVPERTAAQKRELQRQSHRMMLETGVSPAEMAHTLGFDPANMHAYLVRGDIDRFTLEGTKAIHEQLLARRANEADG